MLRSSWFASMTKKKTAHAVLIWLLAVVGLLGWNLGRASSDRKQLAFNIADSFFQQIVMARRWNTGHGGVYVPVTEQTQPNPYLKDRQRDVTTTEGLRLTKINPAFMTRQIAEIAAEEKGLQFHITSLEPIRPGNKATPWEEQQLLAFEKGAEATGEFFEQDGEAKYRFMKPLFVTRGCLRCHAEQGYKEGDIRGGISVILPDVPPDGSTQLGLGYGIVGLGGVLLIVLGGVLIARDRRTIMDSNRKLTRALEEVHTLRGILPLCSFCKKVRDDDGYWQRVDVYITNNSEAMVSHGVCPECAKEHYPDHEYVVTQKQSDNNNDST